jgi:16S rRNA (uracil1498-N3)-methyltransferase
MSYHEFALYVPFLPKNPVVTSSLILDEPILIHRITRVLRLEQGDCCVVFNGTYSSKIRIESIDKKSIIIRFIQVSPLVIQQPRILLLLPLLDREDMEQAIRMATVLGVAEIQLLITHKSAKHTVSLDRVQKISIAACEQSKQFILPIIHKPVLMNQWLEKQYDKASPLLFFDGDGQSVTKLAMYLDTTHLNTTYLNTKKIPSYYCLVGPQGDFIERERTHLEQYIQGAYRLTPSVLRSCDAVALGIGFIRSWCYTEK